MSFPFLVFEKLIELMKSNFNFQGGELIQKNSEQWSEMQWPDKVVALAVVDHKWQINNKNKNIVEDVLPRQGVKILTLMPISCEQLQKLDGPNGSTFFGKIKTAAWHRAALPEPQL